MLDYWTPSPNVEYRLANLLRRASEEEDCRELDQIMAEIRLLLAKEKIVRQETSAG